MVVLLTEDSHSGFEFWRKFNEYLFNGKLQVYNTGYGSKGDTAGNNKFRSAIQNLHNDKKIDENTKLVLIYDSLEGSSNNMQDSAAVFRYQLFDCEALLNSYHIQHFILKRYICWEQLMLSFTKLLKFLPIAHYTDIVRKYERNQWMFTQAVPNITYLTNYFGVRLGIHKSVERGMAKLLTYLTAAVTPNSYKTFLINKGVLGECWWDDCENIRRGKQNIADRLCKKCRVCHMDDNYKLCIGKNRFLFIAKHSQINTVYKCIARLVAMDKQQNYSCSE